MQGAHRHLGNVVDSGIVSDGSYDDGDQAFACGLLDVTHDPGQRDRRSVYPAHKQTLQDDPVELGPGSASQESI